MGDTTKFNHHPLWIANYDVETPNLPASNWGGKSWTIWQMTDRASVPGVNDGEPPVDLNVYKDTPEAMMSWLGITTQRAVPPVAANQEILESLVRAANLTGSDPNLFVQKAGLTYLGNPVENLPRPYDGPALQDLPLTEAEKTAVTAAFADISQGLEPTLVEATNQDVINAFYVIAGQFDIAGWNLIKLARLEYMINDRSSFYTGPVVADLPGLTNEQKTALAVELGVSVPEVSEPDPPPEEPPPEPEPILIDPVLETPAEPIDEPVVEEETPLDIPYPGVSNQAMINVFYQVGKRLEYAGWGLVERAGLTDLGENREADYSGPFIAELDGLNANIQAQLREILEDDLENLRLSLPYPGLLNQDIINMFYRAGSKMGEDGWVWVLIVGLEYMTETRPLRYEPYRGPLFEKYQGLNVEQLTVLQEELAVLLNN